MAYWYEVIKFTYIVGRFMNVIKQLKNQFTADKKDFLHIVRMFIM